MSGRNWNAVRQKSESLSDSPRNTQEQLEEAIGALREAIRLNPNLPEAWCNLGIVLGRSGRLDEAIIHLREATRLKPDYAEARNNLELALRLKTAP